MKDVKWLTLGSCGIPTIGHRATHLCYDGTLSGAVDEPKGISLLCQLIALKGV